jgi:serine/threonine protein kinase
MCMVRVFIGDVTFRSMFIFMLNLFPGRDPLPWSSRVQIALDSARGLEYIHEHTVPVYIHRDIKSANILIDKNFHAKVALLPLLLL